MIINGYRIEPGANLRFANLTGVNLSKMDLRGVGFGFAYLNEADLSEANLAKADLTMASLEGANLKGANLQVVDGLRKTYLKNCIYDNDTIWPDGFDIEEVKKIKKTKIFFERR